MKLFISLLLSVNLMIAKELFFGITTVAVVKNSQTIFELTDFLSQAAKTQITPKFAKDYDEMKLMLEKKEVDFAYVCGATYVEAKDSADLEILTFPYFEGKPLYYSLVIAPKESNARSLLDFENTIYAYSDPKSNSGALVPSCKLRSMGRHYDSFFEEVIYTYDHSESIEAVLKGFVDGASVDSLVYESYKQINPTSTEKLKVIQKMGPFQTTPVVIRKDIDPQVKKRVQKAFHSLSATDKGRQILRKFGVEKFAYTNDYDY
ncbi:MAG: phosphate/phosphite/phosphonate ABC transporter substrate-binding protein, partial [Campylobacterota bacterium]